jgi:hypothetical protein
MLNRWLYHALKRSTQELHLDLRLRYTDLGEHHVKEPYNDEGDGDCGAPNDDKKCPASLSNSPDR